MFPNNGRPTIGAQRDRQTSESIVSTLLKCFLTDQAHRVNLAFIKIRLSRRGVMAIIQPVGLGSN